MRSLFSVVGLVVVLAVIGVIASRQLSGLRTSTAPSTPAAASALPASIGAAAVAQRSPAQLPAQYKQAIEAAMQTARPDDGEAK